MTRLSRTETIPCSTKTCSTVRLASCPQTYTRNSLWQNSPMVGPDSFGLGEIASNGKEMLTRHKSAGNLCTLVGPSALLWQGNTQKDLSMRIPLP